ncbi:hypothetical protein BO219_07180 [Anoxybacillus kestanbolensis]|uniref:Uncharacterized protein n=1 Tax=Anoxybacillus kestanbolensis TaxID=227476 RepID=A0A1V3FPV7_9BACL|nr:hypothetical protein [Anoxybacillus kestanbolensis]OOE03594.1 hypothetical protein BO219_07180 [Anoxybacillus kestanbolensis]
MVITKTEEDFIISPNIEVATFRNDIQLLNLVQTGMQVLNSNLLNLDMATFLRDAYKLGQISLKAIIDAKRKNGDYIEIHRKQVNWLVNYFYYLSELRKNNISYSYCPVLNQHPLEVINGELIGKEHLINACTPERKKDISSSYGEGLGFLLLASLPNVSPFGVLKIINGKESTPDFIVINKFKKVVMLSEVKSSINDRPSDPKDQLSKYSSNISGLGIQVKFNSGKSPVEIILKDPQYNILDGSIVSSIYTNITILESLLRIEEKDIVKVKNPEWAREVVRLFKGILENNHLERMEKININEVIVDNYFFTGIDKLDHFFNLYFDYKEDGSKGFEKIFKIIV